MRQLPYRLAAMLSVAFLSMPAAYAGTPSAGGSGMPWEDTLSKLLTSIQGPVARFFILVAIIVTGVGFAFGEHGGGFKKMMGVVCGGSMIIGLTSFVSTLFGASF